MYSRKNLMKKLGAGSSPFGGFPRYWSAKKEPAASYSRAGESRTTLGDGALDFRVRNGNGYFSPSVATGEKPELEAKENHNPHARAREIPHLVKCVEI